MRTGLFWYGSLKEHRGSVAGASTEVELGFFFRKHNSEKYKRWSGKWSEVNGKWLNRIQSVGRLRRRTRICGDANRHASAGTLMLVPCCMLYVVFCTLYFVVKLKTSLI